MDKIAVKLGLREPTLTESLTSQVDEAVKDCCPSLSFTERAMGVGACFAIGLVLDCIAFVAVAQFNFTVFGLLYSCGNVVALCGTFFLVGPWKQLKRMLDPERLIATIVYLVSIGFTIFVVVYDKFDRAQRLLLLIIALVFQFLALIWFENVALPLFMCIRYVLSYIPGARRCVKSCCATCIT
mmetsp:Transcript_12606/g.29439  ORF Transcript_12606/g.29439 Transcript_12606/m.29439 type:complete len:183 (+) Transcript_12606:3-551(+)